MCLRAIYRHLPIVELSALDFGLPWRDKCLTCFSYSDSFRLWSWAECGVEIDTAHRWLLLLRFVTFKESPVWCWRHFLNLLSSSSSQSKTFRFLSNKFWRLPFRWFLARDGQFLFRLSSRFTLLNQYCLLGNQGFDSRHAGAELFVHFSNLRLRTQGFWHYAI